MKKIHQSINMLLMYKHIVLHNNKKNSAILKREITNKGGKSI